MKIKKEQTAAVVIDIQERLLPAMNEKEKVLQNTVKFLKGVRLLDVPVYLTQQYTKGLGNTVSEIREAAGTDAYLNKLRFSAYEELRKVLKAPSEQKFILICGMESHICVLQTAIDLKEHGYQPVFVTDCITSRKPEDMDIALRRAEQEGILLTSTESILFELTEAAGTEVFKAVQQLIK